MMSDIFRLLQPFKKMEASWDDRKEGVGNACKTGEAEQSKTLYEGTNTDGYTRGL